MDLKIKTKELNAEIIFPHDLRLTRFFQFLMGFVFIILLTPGCSNDKPIKIGYAGTLTGRLSDLGTAGRNGVIMAVEELNRQGGVRGRPVELIIRDDKNDPKTALQVDREMIDLGVAAIIGHVTSDMCLAALEIINRNKMVMVSPTASSSRLTGMDDYFFRVCPDSDAQNIHLARYTRKNLNLKRLAIVWDKSNIAYAQVVYKVFQKTFENLGGIVIQTETFTSGKTPSYFDLAGKLLMNKPDGIFIVASPMDTAMICQQLKKLNSNLPIISSGWGLASSLLQHGGKSVEQVVFSHSLDEMSKEKSYVKFKKQFTHRFGFVPEHPAAVFGYEAAQVLFTVLTKKTNNLKQSILSQKIFQGLQGDLVIDPFGDVQRRHSIIVVKNGKFITLEQPE